MSGSDRTTSQHAQQQRQREHTAVAIANERLPWIAAIQDRFGIDRSAWRALVESIFPSARTVEGVILALSYCKARKLDVFKRPVHIVPIWNSDLGREVETVWPGIGELRTTAMRTAEFAGFDECKFGPDITQSFSGTIGRNNNAREVTVEVTFPQWAQLTCYRFMGRNGDRVVIAGPRVHWTETYSSIGRTRVPNDRWQRAPRQMIEKCAEAACLRRAFPEELGSDTAVDEIGGSSDGITINGQAEDAADAAPAQREPEPRRQEQARTEPKPEPREKRADPRPEAPPPAQPSGQPAPSPEESGSRPAPSGDAAPPAEPALDPEGFQGWLVGADGLETTVEPYTDPVAMARALTDMCQPDTVAPLLELNEGAIGDAADASAEAKVILDRLRVPPTTVSQEPAQRQPVAVPKTRSGAAHWPNYAEECQKELAACMTSAEIDAWIQLNRPSYVERAIEAGILKHIRARRAEIGEPAQNDAPASQEPSPEPAKVDKDEKTASNFITALAQYKTVGEVGTYSNSMVVMTTLERWTKDGRPELVQRVKRAFEERIAELRKDAGNG